MVVLPAPEGAVITINFPKIKKFEFKNQTLVKLHLQLTLLFFQAHLSFAPQGVE